VKGAEVKRDRKWNGRSARAAYEQEDPRSWRGGWSGAGESRRANGYEKI
jgi:hypothetical protein